MSAGKPRRPSAPRTLQARGRRFWRAVLDEVDMDLDGLELLRETCEVLDTIDRLRTQIAEQGETVAGSMGQPRLNSLVPELRHQRGQLADFLNRLGIEPGEEHVTGVLLAAVPDSPTPAQRQAARRAELKRQANSRRATKAAQARWR